MSELALRLQSLASMAHALSRSAPFLPLLETAAEEARATLHAASVSISRVELDRGVVKTLINAGELGPGEVRWPDDEVYVIDEFSRLGQAVHERTSWTESLTDPDCDPYERELLLTLGKGSSLAAPILISGAVWGEFYLTRHVGAEPFDDEALSYAEVLAAMLGAAIDRTLREAVLEGIARRDPLTGLSNRRDFDECTARMFDLEGVESRWVTMVSTDVNDLKVVNDTLGHAQGDLLIRSVGHALEAAFADLPDVCIARVGGDEFALVVADHSAAHVVRRMDATIHGLATTVPRAGVSVGVASAELAPGTHVTPLTLFAAADRAQYDAKRTRATRAVVAGDGWALRARPAG